MHFMYVLCHKKALLGSNFFYEEQFRTHTVIFKFRLPLIFGPDISALSVSIFLYDRPSKCKVQYIKA